MERKMLSLFAVAALFARGITGQVNEVSLPDETINHVDNPLFGRAIAIPHGILETLVTCYVKFPSNLMYELYPNNNLVSDNIKPSIGNAPFDQCGVEFRGVSEGHSGTYELISMVEGQDGQVSVSRKNFNMNFIVSEIEMP